MSKTVISRKPIAQLVFIFYFFPISIALLWIGVKGVGQNTALLSTALIALSSLILFFTVKRWEQAFVESLKIERQIAPQQEGRQETEEKAIQEAVQQATAAAANSEKALKDSLKQKEEEIYHLIDTVDQVNQEKKLCLQQLEEKRSSYETMIAEKEEGLRKAADELLELKLTLIAKDTRITTLQSEIENLQFELKTLLKLEKSVTIQVV